MIKINLLPREIRERRKAERLVPLMIFGLFTLACSLCALYAFNVWRISTAESQVAILSNQTQVMNDCVQTLIVYEQRLQEVQKKKQIAEKVVEGRILWSKILEELMVKTPRDVTLTSLSGNAEGITFSGTALNQKDQLYSGHKPVARWLIELSEMKYQPYVWLGSSDKKGQVVVFSNNIRFKKTPDVSVASGSSGK